MGSFMNKKNNMNRQRFSGFGPRTRLDVLAGKNIRKGDDGTDIFDDYFTDDDDDSSDTSVSDPTSVTRKDSNVILNNYISDSSKSKTPCVSRKDSNLVNDNVVADSSKAKASDVTHRDSNLIQDDEQDTLSMNSSNSLAETIKTKHPDSLSPDIHINTNSSFSNTCSDTNILSTGTRISKNILSTGTRIDKNSLLLKEVPVALSHTFMRPTRKTQCTAELDKMFDMFDEYDLQLMSKTGVSEDDAEETSSDHEDDSDHHGSAGEKSTSRSVFYSKKETVHAASPVSSKSSAFDRNKPSNNSNINKNVLVSSVPSSTDVIDNFQNDGAVNINDKPEENTEIIIRRKTHQILRSENLSASDSTESKETEISKVGNSSNKSAKKSLLHTTRMTNKSSYIGANNNTSPLHQNEKGKPDYQTNHIEINGNVFPSSETQTDKNKHAKSERKNKNKENVHSSKKRKCNATFSISPNKNKSNKHTDALNSKNNPPLISVAENSAALGNHQAVVNKTFCKSSDRSEDEQNVCTPKRNGKTTLFNSDDDNGSVAATYGSPDDDNQNPSTTENRNSFGEQSAISTLNELTPSKNNEPPADLTRTFTPKKRVDKSNNAVNAGKKRKNILPSVSPLKKIVRSRKKDRSKLAVNSNTNSNINRADKLDNARKIKNKAKNLSPPISPSKNNRKSLRRNSNKLVGNSSTSKNINEADNDLLGENVEAAFTTSQKSTPQKQADKSNNMRQIRKSQRINSTPVSTLKSNPRSSKRNSRKLVENSSAHQNINEAHDDILGENSTAAFTTSQTFTPKKRANESENAREMIKKQRSNLSPPISPSINSLSSVKRKLIENSSTRDIVKEVCNNDVIEEETNELANSDVRQNIEINDDIQDEEINELNTNDKRAKHTNTVDSAANKDLGETSVVKRKIKRKKHEATAERKSSRQRFPPLDHWRNQRPVYAEKDGELQLLKIDSGFEIDDQPLRAILRSQRARVPKKISKPKKAKLVLPEENCTQSIELFKKFPRLSWENLNKTGDGSKSELHLATLFETNKVAFGYLQIEKSKEKPTQLMKDDDLHLVVMRGKAEVNIQENTCIVSERDAFIVPRSTFYSVKNIGREKLLISYAVGKFKFLESTE